MTETDLFIVSNEEAGIRLDKYLSLHFPHYSRTYFQKLIEKKLILVNTEQVKKACKLESGDEIEIEFTLTPEISIAPEAIALDIIYEDDYLLAINKPPGMVVHPAVGNWSGTFVNALLYHCAQISSHENLRPGIVHRLDKDTSGILLAAKDEYTQRKLVEAFGLRQIEKEYLAICVGNPGKKEISTLIGRHAIRRKEMAVLENRGKMAKTYCETMSSHENLSLVRLIPFTGRTHQLRVHMQFIGFPILGDKVYGSPSANKKFGAMRQLLHARSLCFSHPRTTKSIELTAPVPEDMQFFIKKFL